MAGKKKHYEKGAVLIIVLFIISGLAVVSVELNRNVLLDHAFFHYYGSWACFQTFAEKRRKHCRVIFLCVDFRKKKTSLGRKVCSLCKSVFASGWKHILTG